MNDYTWDVRAGAALTSEGGCVRLTRKVYRGMEGFPGSPLSLTLALRKKDGSAKPQGNTHIGYLPAELTGAYSRYLLDWWCL